MSKGGKVGNLSLARLEILLDWEPLGCKTVRRDVDAKVTSNAIWIWI